MNYLNNAQQLEDEFNQLFPIRVNHSGGEHTCHDFAELEEWDSASGELWANFLDDKGFSADFDLSDLERRGDDLILEMYVKSTLESYINGNITSALEDFETMLQECDFDDVIDFMNDSGYEKNVNEIILKLLKGNY